MSPPGFVQYSSSNSCAIAVRTLIIITTLRSFGPINNRSKEFQNWSLTTGCSLLLFPGHPPFFSNRHNLGLTYILLIVRIINGKHHFRSEMNTQIQNISSLVGIVIIIISSSGSTITLFASFSHHR